VDGAFLLKKPELLRNRHVLLVDDVVTTGATMVACVREILKAEGVNISLISLGFTKS
jgi:predicted amidophosphoribosyltransferase